MKWILTLIIIFSVGFIFGQNVDVEKIRICDEPSVEKYYIECSDAIETSTDRERKYYDDECKKRALASYCEYKCVVITKRDTIFCNETKKRKYLKLCEICD